MSDRLFPPLLHIRDFVSENWITFCFEGHNLKSSKVEAVAAVFGRNFSFWEKIKGSNEDTFLSGRKDGRKAKARRWGDMKVCVLITPFLPRYYSFISFCFWHVTLKENSPKIIFEWLCATCVFPRKRYLSSNPPNNFAYISEVAIGVFFVRRKKSNGVSRFFLLYFPVSLSSKFKTRYFLKIL